MSFPEVCTPQGLNSDSVSLPLFVKRLSSLILLGRARPSAVTG